MIIILIIIIILIRIRILLIYRIVLFLFLVFFLVILIWIIILKLFIIMFICLLRLLHRLLDLSPCLSHNVLGVWGHPSCPLVVLKLRHSPVVEPLRRLGGRQGFQMEVRCRHYHAQAVGRRPVGRGAIHENPASGGKSPWSEARASSGGAMEAARPCRLHRADPVALRGGLQGPRLRASLTATLRASAIDAPAATGLLSVSL